ncbi:MAG: hypothetical protein WCS94_23250, partial [Verrucomicrobiota bacterium]
LCGMKTVNLDQYADPNVLREFSPRLEFGADAFYEVSPRLPVTAFESKSVSACSQAKILSASRPVREKYREIADAFGLVAEPSGGKNWIELTLYSKP